MKKLMMGLLVLAAAASSTCAEIDWKTYPAGLEEPVQINLGAGLGTPLYGGTVIPPLEAYIDLKLPLGGSPLLWEGF